MLVDTQSCPLCGSESIKSVDQFLLVPEGGWVYISKILKRNQKDTLKIAEEMKPFKCLTCGTYFYSPWFSEFDAANAFMTAVSRHQSGWLNLQHVLTSKSPNTVQQLNMSILKSIFKECSIKKYGEIGCPHQGLNVVDFSSETKTSFGRVLRFCAASLTRGDSRNSLPMRLSDFFKNIGLFLSCFGMLVKSFFRFFLKSSDHHYPELPPLKGGGKYFLSTTTAYGWGSACEGFGLPCQKLAGNLYGAKIVPFWDLEGDLSFDLIGIFNSFDHLSNPIKVLDKALLVAKNVIITLHKPEYAGKQHRLILGTDFIHFLKNRYDAHRVDVFESSRFGSFSKCDQYNVFILRRIS